VVGVLSVAKLTLGQEAYYEQQVVRGLDDYYAGRGESPGIWAGQGAAELELSGVIHDDDLGTLLRGVNPASGKQLRKPVRERTITRRTLDVETGEWHEQQKRLAPLSGYDLVFSCPKSVSVLHALTDDERVRREISEAHEASWQAAFVYLEREACVVRLGKGGNRREHGQGFVAAAFRHRTSRAQDPHLHTHVIVANMARAEDGTWLALDGVALLQTYRLAAGYLYEAQLRHELTQRLSLAWTEPVKGMGELESVPEEAIRAFSRRREALVEHMERRDTHGFAAARVAALATRETKEQIDLPQLRDDWQARAAEHGLGRNEVRRVVVRGREPDREIAIDRLARELFGPQGLTARQTTFTTPELVCAIAGKLTNGAPVDQVLETTEQLSRCQAVELVEPSRSPGRPARFTTNELLHIERQALELALNGFDVDAPCPDRTTLARMLMESGRHLGGDQGILVHHAGMLPDRVVCVTGAAGTGKTTALRVLADAYLDSDVPMLGAAPSGRAADELGSATGIASCTLHRLLLDAQRAGCLPPGCVLVVDEAGMADTRTLAPVLELVGRARGKAILVGDPHQLPAVGAGGLYSALCERLGAINLTENRRQRDADERVALNHLRHGDPEAYLAHAARSGRLHLDTDPIAAKQRLLEDWWQTASRDLAGSVMLAYHREDVHDLNQAARALMLRADRLGSKPLQLGEREFRVGDRVLCRHNDPGLHVRNGMRGTIVAIDHDSETLTVRIDAGYSRQLPSAYAAEHLDHAYALTGHAAQGATVDHAYVLLRDHGALREWGYVALSRASAETHLYLAEPDAIERETPLRDPNRNTSPERALRALTRSSVEPLAFDQRRHEEIHARKLSRQFDELERQRTRATNQLATAERELKRLGWWKRGDRRFELEAEVARRRAALQSFDKRRTRLERTPAPTPPLPAPIFERDELMPTRALRPEPPGGRTPQREPPGRGLEL
jgi:conjugative relaxase-like TrwC/TraI family protein